MLNLEAIRLAAARIAPYVKRTPVLESASLNDDLGASLYFKCENFQRVGAFKARGAVNAVFSLSLDDARKGVATHSSGNHGAALARAAALRGMACHVIVPEGANRVKRAAIERYGANVIECEASMRGREQALERVIAATGANVVHPYADARVMAGQGTVALELLDQLHAPDMVLIPLGGGGLISGCATVIKALSPQTRVIGVEPEGAAEAKASLAKGEITPLDKPDTIADGLRATIGEPNFAIVREKVDAVVSVSDAAIIEAMRMSMERLKIVVEPSAVVGLAALLENRVDVKEKHVAIVLTGGNVDLDALPWV